VCNTEHTTGGGLGPSNPRHVFEIHLAPDITCGSRDLSFIKSLRSFPDLRHISAGSAHTRITQLKMWVRYHHVDGEYQYESFQDRSVNCGNFVVVEVSCLPQEWIQATGGGQTAIGRVTANGSTTITLKLYSIEDTPTAGWFARLKKQDASTVHALCAGCSPMTTSP
jgi:hypothetical protein